MQNTVDIGRGRTARRTYGLDDINIVPSRRTRSASEVNTEWKIDAYTFDFPIMSHPTDAIVTPEFAIEFGQLGGLPVINAEGLWGRHKDLDGALKKVTDLAHSPSADESSVIELLQELHSAPLDPELLTERLEQVRSSGVTFGVRVSPQHVQRLAPILQDAGIDLLIIQGTLISAEHVDSNDQVLNLKEFISTIRVPVIAGGVVDYTTAMHLMRSGVVGVIVGAGNTTNGMALGIDIPMATAISDAAAARRDYLDETEGRYVHVIADSDLLTAGEVAKAIACGADAVALGAPLAVASTAGGKGFYWPSVAAHPKYPRGEVELVSSEPEDLSVILRGPSSDPYGTLNIVGGLTRAVAKCGYSELKKFQKVDLSIRT